MQICGVFFLLLASLFRKFSNLPTFDGDTEKSPKRQDIWSFLPINVILFFFHVCGQTGTSMTCQLTKQTHRYVHVDLVSRPTARKHDRSISFVQCTSEFRISLVHLSRACVASVKFQIIDSPVGKCLKKEKKEEKTKKNTKKKHEQI